MATDRTWPLPSDSRRVRRLLYLAEGLVLGSGSLLLAVRFAGAFLVDVRTGAFDPTITPFGAFTLLFLVFLGLRYAAIRRVSPPTRQRPAEYRNWSETREWRWVLAVAMLVCVVLAGSASAVWNPREMVVLQSFDVLVLGAVLAGVLLYAYVLHRLGM